MTETALFDDLRRHLAELGGPADVSTELDLFGTGALKSMQLMELINCLEDHYDLRVEERDVMSGRLRSLSAISRLVRERGRSS